MAEGGGEGQERTEDPTDKRREEAREKGQVPYSKEASNVMIFLAAVALFFLLRNVIVEQMLDCFNHFFRFGGYIEMTASDVQYVITSAGGFLFRATGPVLAVVFVVALASNVLQFGFVYSPERIDFNLDRLNVIDGLQRMFSLRQVVEGFKAGLKVLVVASIVYLVFQSQMGRIETMVDEPPGSLFEHIVWTSLLITWKVSIFLVAVGVLDFAYQRWEYSRSLRMSRQELKDEMKEREGDPLVKQRIRQIRAERARQRMMSEVPKADVVVTNPTHVAVALRYERTKMSAPKVVAKGAGYIASKIREVARQSQVPIVENKPVARILYKACKVGQEIPFSLYKAIAGILAYVYKTAKKKPRWF